MSNYVKRALLAVCLLMLPLASHATIINLSSTLSGANEVPANASPAYGTATMTFDDVSNLFSWDITYADLLTDITMAHFHGAAPAGVNAGVQFPIPLGVAGTSGQLIGNAIITPVQETDLLNGLWYINIHTSTYPGGEIRGQVIVDRAGNVPEPATLALLGLGLAGIALGKRKTA